MKSNNSFPRKLLYATIGALALSSQLSGNSNTKNILSNINSEYKQNSLEDIIQPDEIKSEEKINIDESYNNKLVDYLNSKQKSPDLDKDYMSGAKISYVSPNELPKDVLGMYDPQSHSIYIRNDLPEPTRNFVEKHESAHARGLRDEWKTDRLLQ